MKKIPLGRSDDLPERGSLRFRIHHRGREVDAFAIRAEGEVRAFLNICTHRDLELDLGMGTFFTSDGALLVCKAHGALYQPLDGSCAGGICMKKASLTAVPVADEDGQLFALELEEE